MLLGIVVNIVRGRVMVCDRSRYGLCMGVSNDCASAFVYLLITNMKYNYNTNKLYLFV